MVQRRMTVVASRTCIPRRRRAISQYNDTRYRLRIDDWTEQPYISFTLRVGTHKFCRESECGCPASFFANRERNQIAEVVNLLHEQLHC